MLHFHSLKVADVRRETEDTVSVAFEVPDALADQYRFVQGQHLTLRTFIDGEEVRRNYSICTGVDDGELRVAIKKVPGGRFSTFANENLKPGDVLDVLPPSGKFHVPLDPAAHRLYLAFAAGSGITPVISIIKTTLAREPHSRFLLFYGNRTVGSIIFREELEDLKNRYMGRFSVFHILSREIQDVELFNGRIDGDKVRRLARSFLNLHAVDQVFLCGPAAMIEELRATLIDLGMPAERIHFELFTTGAVQAVQPQGARRDAGAAAGTACRVSVTLDGVETEFDLPAGGGTILEGALAQGLDLPYSCKGGVCSTCRAKVREGEVEMAVNYALEPHEVAAGFVLTCQARPLSPRVAVDFDAQ